MTEIKELQHVNPFLYTQESPWKYRFVGLLGFISTVIAGIGFVRFLSLSTWYWIIFGPIALLLFFNHLLRNFLRTIYPGFSKKQHIDFVEKFWQKNEESLVAVFLPYCGESKDVFEKTLIGVNNLYYKNRNVYILDDKGNSEIELLSKKYKVKYLSRPNKGEYKKSGNLQYGWDHSNGEEFAFILDADFIPIPDALYHCMPYILSNSKIGILQTPQYFEQTKEKHESSPIEFGGGNIVEEFYSLDQVSRDRFDAAICVGTSAVYRRAAIMSVGGTPKVWGTEDVRTGLSITRGGYKVKYIPLIVSIGTSPDTLQDYFRQHNRWCSGSLQILFDYYIKAKIGLMGKIIYLMNPLYYISEALTPILVFHFIALIAFQPNTIALYNSILFIPKLLYELFVMPVLMRNHRPKMGSKLAAMNNIFTYFYTIFLDMPRKRQLLWHPAGVALNGVSKEFRVAMRIGIILTSTYIISLAYVLILRKEYLLNIQMSMLLLWSLYVAVWYMIYIYYATSFLKKHDRNYIHQSSKIITYTRRIWAHIKHLIVPTLTAFLFLSLYFNIYNLWMKKFNFNDEEIVSSKSISVINEVEIINQIDQIKIDGSVYKVKLEYKDGKTNIARKAIKMYLDESSLILTNKQLIFAEDSLQKELANIPKKYSKNINISVSREKVEFHVNKTLNSVLVKES